MTPNIEAKNDVDLAEPEDDDYINETGTAFGWGASCVSHCVILLEIEAYFTLWTMCHASSTHYLTGR